MLKYQLFILLIVLFVGCSDEVKTNKDWAIDTVCIEHHVYYETPAAGGIAPKLTDEGKPCHCDW